MYVLAAGATSMNVLSLHAPGQAQDIQSLDVSGPALAAGLALSKFASFDFGFHDFYPCA